MKEGKLEPGLPCYDIEEVSKKSLLVHRIFLLIMEWSSGKCKYIGKCINKILFSAMAITFFLFLIFYDSLICIFFPIV